MYIEGGLLLYKSILYLREQSCIKIQLTQIILVRSIAVVFWQSIDDICPRGKENILKEMVEKHC